MNAHELAGKFVEALQRSDDTLRQTANIPVRSRRDNPGVRTTVVMQPAEIPGVERHHRPVVLGRAAQNFVVGDARVRPAPIAHGDRVVSPRPQFRRQAHGPVLVQ